MMNTKKKQFVAVIGGSISGSETAHVLAQNGFHVVVFEMNALPYGKIEDGLPNWHINLRNRQQAEIDRKLSGKNIFYVPQTKIGRDIDFLDLVHHWGFSAIILANGAWKDRAFPVEGAERYRDKGLIYQNDLIHWFNHKHEPGFNGKNFKIKEEAVVIGGGLASLDVVKICMIELVSDKLKHHFGIEADPFKIEKQGIDKYLAQCDLQFSDLKVNGVTLVYRRTARDMPLKSPRNEKPESISKARDTSEKLLNNYIKKYKFNFIPLHTPVNFVEEKGQLTGVVLQEVEEKNGRLSPIENQTKTIKTPLIISSIGSLPEQIDGLSYEWSALKMKKGSDYRVFGFDHVFAVGNAVTGRGNIQESKQHGSKITRAIIDKHLTDDALEDWLEKVNENIKSKTHEKLGSIISDIRERKTLPETTTQMIVERVSQINTKQSYKSYEDWIRRHKPVRLEER